MQRICDDVELKKFFDDGRTHTVEELRSVFNLSASVAYRELKRLNTTVALNKPGHYALRGSRRVDGNGFFRIGELVFYSKGSLPQALTSLASNSPAGMTVPELEKVVLTNAKVQLLNLVESKEINRKKIEGKYHYFSCLEEIAAIQKRTRDELSGNSDIALIMEKAESVPLSLVVRILVVIIKHPEFSPKSVALSLARRGVDATTEKVKAVFAKYDLEKKTT